VTLTPKHIKLQLRQDVEARANDLQAFPNERLKLIVTVARIEELNLNRKLGRLGWGSIRA
jgi:hypothetical protein